jgi:hypothetical protein
MHRFFAGLRLGVRQSAMFVREGCMDEPHIRFRLSHVLLSITVVAPLLIAAVSCATVYQTDGVIAQLIVAVILVVALTVPLICLRFRKLRLLAVLVVLFVCGLFTYQQSQNVHRLKLMQSEVLEIVKYCDAFKATNGRYPADLRGYQYHFPEFRSLIEYRVVDPKDYPNHEPSLTFQPYYELSFSPTDPGKFSYYYDSTNKNWIGVDD